MRAISLHQPWASMIASGEKTIETRWWRTHHRGDLLICSTKKPMFRDMLCGYALAIVDVWDCLPYCADHAQDAWFDENKAKLMLKLQCQNDDQFYSWFLRDIRRIKEPFKVVGRQRFFNVGLPNFLAFTSISSL